MANRAQIITHNLILNMKLSTLMLTFFFFGLTKSACTYTVLKRSVKNSHIYFVNHDAQYEMVIEIEGNGDCVSGTVID